VYCKKEGFPKNLLLNGLHNIKEAFYMRIETTLKRLESAETSLRVLYRLARTWDLPKEKIFAEKDIIRKDLSKCPRWAQAQFHGYNRALWDQLTAELVFLYNVDGQLYKTLDKVTDLPRWDTLPESLWPTLSDKGGFYYPHSLKPF
jgi:hypothetical protein